MKWTPYDIFTNAVLCIVGIATLIVGQYISEDMNAVLTIWIALVSCSIFSMYISMVYVSVCEMKGHRTKLGKEIDALRERVDALEKRGL